MEQRAWCVELRLRWGSGCAAAGWRGRGEAQEGGHMGIQGAHEAGQPLLLQPVEFEFEFERSFECTSFDLWRGGLIVWQIWAFLTLTLGLATRLLALGTRPRSLSQQKISHFPCSSTP